MRLSEIDMGKYVMGKYIRRIIVYIPANDYSLPIRLVLTHFRLH